MNVFIPGKSKLVNDADYILWFIEDFWASLTPERSFLARVFVSHCIETKDEARLESALPVVTALAFQIQGGYNALLEGGAGQVEAEGEEERQNKEDERMDREFVVGELLRLACDLDYADEIGRRKMFGLVRESPFLAIYKSPRVLTDGEQAT